MFFRARGLAIWLATAPLLGVLTASAPVAAQSAADKSTARRLATEGIKLYEAGKFADGLEKLERAQALFDAPVHVVYIARCQVKLGRLVEAAENYRKLSRTPLEASAPKAFRDAVDAAPGELAAFESKIPALRIDVAPSGVAELVLRLDGERIPAAGLGVDRPANPGHHVIEGGAPGYAPVHVEFDVSLNEKKVLPVELIVQPGAVAPAPGGSGAGGAGGTSGGGGVGGTSGASGASAGGAPGKPPSGKLGFLLGVRLGSGIPLGDIEKDGSGTPLPSSDYFAPGGGGELRGGVRFLRYFGVALFAEHYTLSPGTVLKTGIDSTETVTVESVTEENGGGLELTAGTPRGQFGAFGSLAFVAQTFSATSTATIEGVGSCTIDRAYSGTAFRLGGGLSVPISSSFVFTPYVLGAWGKFDHFAGSQDCGSKLPSVQVPTRDIQDSSQTAHLLLGLGVGIDWLLGAE